jgi:hypothetical protein
MVVRRARDFDKEAPKITRVAGAKRAPEQLGLDELLPGNVHGWGQIQPTDYGYIAHCLCGWRARELPSRADAHSEIRRHIARTPEGSILVRNLRRFGRGAAGA